MPTSAKEIIHIRENGVFYTPEPVAALLADRANYSNGAVLDPACGDGALLSATYKKRGRIGGSRKLHLTGCDLFKPKDGALPAGTRFVKTDFFSYTDTKQFDLVLTNPPYLQSGRLARKKRDAYYNRYGKPLGMGRNTDLWVYFLVKSASHLKKGGTLAAIVPWSLLEADFAVPVRQWMSDNFASISVLLLRDAHFEGTAKRVVLVWLHGYGTVSKNIELAFSEGIEDKHSFRAIQKDLWVSDARLTFAMLDTGSILRRVEQCGFVPFESYADVNIGVVTGANSYFILRDNEATVCGFSERSTLAILTRVKDLRGLAVTEETDKRLLQFNRLTKRRRAYVDRGLKLNIDKRSHCRRRSNGNGGWYRVDPGKVPDAFFTYRVSKIPYLTLNPKKYQCTNSLHKVFFKKLTQREKKWIQLSLLSVFGQLSIEIISRHYGNGIIKIEPGGLREVLVFKSKAAISTKDYARISELINEGNKSCAVMEATELVASVAGAKADLVDKTLWALNRVRDRRGAGPL